MRSAQLSPEDTEAKPIATTAPIPVITQNARAGRSRVRSTAITAVAAGSRAITTAPWLAGVVVRA